MKRRRVWWLVGGAVLILVIAAVGLFVQSSSPDAQMEAMLQDVLERYGFEASSEFSAPDMEVEFVQYEAPGLSREETDEMFAYLAGVCEGCTVTTHDATVSGDQRFYSIETDGSYSTVQFIEGVHDQNGIGASDGPDSFIVVGRSRGPAWLNSVKNLLPW